MPDQSITVAVEVENLEEVKELRKELEKIRDLKKELQELEKDEEDEDGWNPIEPDDDHRKFPWKPHDDPNPRPFPEPEYPKRPRFWVMDGEEKQFEFEDDDSIKAETTFQV